MKVTSLVGPEMARPEKSSAVSVRSLLCVFVIAGVLIVTAQAQTYTVL